MKKAAPLLVLMQAIAMGSALLLQGVGYASAQQIRDLEIVRDPSRQVSKKAGTIVESEAKCPDGKKVVSGGFSIVHGEGNPIHATDNVKVFQSVPKADSSGWYVRAWVYGQDAALYYQAIAICAKIRDAD